MKIDEYNIIKLIKNMDPVNLERTVDYYERCIIDNDMRSAVIAAIKNKGLDPKVELKLVKAFGFKR